MRFGYTIIYVDNVLDTLDFYEKAFGLKRSFVAESSMYAEVDGGSNTKLGFVSAEFAESNGTEFVRNNKSNKAAGFEIAFTTENVEVAYNKACGAGATGLKGPHNTPWGQMVAYVRDNNGIIVEICTEMK